MKELVLIVCAMAVAAVIGMNAKERYADKGPAVMAEKEIIVGTRVDGNGQLQNVTRTYLVRVN